MNFLKMSLDTTIIALDRHDFLHTKILFGDKWEFCTKKLADLYD